VDALFGALARALPGRIPAASQGTMNNVAMGGAGFAYYETLAGGMGARRGSSGPGGVHSHMTNTLNTPIEALERSGPVRVTRYALRKGSGGRGRFRGGDGLVREYEFLGPAHVSILGERRTMAPWGLAGGGPGKSGIDRLNGKRLPGRASFLVKPGDRLTIETPGGGGYGPRSEGSR
jgi:N-methylhydantoinase B